MFWGYGIVGIFAGTNYRCNVRCDVAVARDAVAVARGDDEPISGFARTPRFTVQGSFANVRVLFLSYRVHVILVSQSRKLQ